jgi:hypothetical protein
MRRDATIPQGPTGLRESANCCSASRAVFRWYLWNNRLPKVILRIKFADGMKVRSGS